MKGSDRIGSASCIISHWMIRKIFNGGIGSYRIVSYRIVLVSCISCWMVCKGAGRSSMEGLDWVGLDRIISVSCISRKMVCKGVGRPSMEESLGWFGKMLGRSSMEESDWIVSVSRISCKMVCKDAGRSCMEESDWI